MASSSNNRGPPNHRNGERYPRMGDRERDDGNRQRNGYDGWGKADQANQQWSQQPENRNGDNWIENKQNLDGWDGGPKENLSVSEAQLSASMSQIALDSNVTKQSNLSTHKGHGRGRPLKNLSGQDTQQGRVIVPSTTDGPLTSFFSFGAPSAKVLFVPPMTDHRNPCRHDSKRAGMNIVIPGLSLGQGVDPDKVYVDEYKKAFDKRIEEISLHPQEDSDYQPPSSQSYTSRPGLMAPSGKDTSIIGPYVTKINRNQNDDVWDKYDMGDYKFDTTNLAVYKQKSRIMSSLKSQQVMIVEGFTGCGKTTQIPQFILNEAAASGKSCNIVVTQPRRIAALSVAQRVCDERRWDLGSLVGYQVGLSRRSSPDTRLIYMTTGILLQTLISRKRLDEYTHIIVDEVHERDLETDLLLLVIKKIMVDQADKVTKIILMSATLNAIKFAEYFPKWRECAGAGIVRIPPDAIYPVTEYYLDTIPDLQIADLKTEGFDEPKIRQECYDYAVQIVMSLERVEASQSELSGKYAAGRGGVLIFLPGMMEIDTLYKILREYAQEKCGGVDSNDELKWLLLPLHSLISAEDQQKVFKKVEKGYRKIILATNIAESSITVTDITFVIDFCLTKSLSCDPTTNYSCLRLEWASKNQCTQRKGRVGRVSIGICYRMVPIQFFHQLRDEALPDMEKACLENVVLDVKNLNLGSPKAILALSIDPPKLNGIRLAVANLKEVGALSITVGGHYTALDGDMTPMGIIMAKLPFDIRLSRLIVLGHVFGVLEESVIIAAGLSVKSPFTYPYHRRLIAFMSKAAWAGETYSDCFAILSLYRTWRQKIEAYHFRTLQEERNWAKTYFVQLNVMKEIHTLILDITRRLSQVNIDLRQPRLIDDTLNSEQGLLLKMVISGAFYPNYFLRHRPVQKDYEKNIIRELSGYNPMFSLVFNGFPADQPGQLYAECISRYFMHHNCIPYVHFSSSKVIVTSDPRSVKIGLVSQNVYRGIKMRQIREPIIINTLRSDLSHDVLRNELELENRINRLLCPRQVPLPSIKTETFDIVISHFMEIDNFWGVYKNKYNYLEEIGRLLKQQANNLNVVHIRDVVPGVICIVEDEGEFLRGRIDFYNGSLALVHCIDLGKSIWRRPNNILAFNAELIHYELHTLEQQAMQFRLFGVKPLARYSSLWGSEITKICKNFISSFKNNLQAKIFSIVESVIACDLIGDSHAPTLRETLLEDRKVAPTEEPRQSKENNNARHMIKVAIECREDEVKCHDDRQVNRQGPIKVIAPPTRDCDNEITLRGPFSPLEMNFTSLCRSAHMKQVQIEGNSVNSVALDQEPTSKTARLLVAAGVAISQRSGNVMAKDSTLMPAIPGLVGLLTMIFCPKMELRYNRRLMRYTGCLSGLGVDPTTKDPVYGDHDVEIVFDTMFDNDDIEKINSIRITISHVLCAESGYGINIENLRSSVRRELQDLLERERDPVEEEYVSRTHAWGLLKEEEFLVVDGHQQRANSAHVFPLHRVVDTNLKFEYNAETETADSYNYTGSYTWDENE